MRLTSGFSLMLIDKMTNVGADAEKDAMLDCRYNVALVHMIQN